MIKDIQYKALFTFNNVQIIDIENNIVTYQNSELEEDIAYTDYLTEEEIEMLEHGWQDGTTFCLRNIWINGGDIEDKKFIVGAIAGSK